jgi:hypothetical protein
VPVRSPPDVATIVPASPTIQLWRASTRETPWGSGFSPRADLVPVVGAAVGENEGGGDDEGGGEIDVGGVDRGRFKTRTVQRYHARQALVRHI